MSLPFARYWMPFALLAAPAVHAEESAPWIAPRHLIDVNPAALISGELSLEYEQALGSHASLLIGPDAIVFDSPLYRRIHARGFALKTGVHFFPWGNALNGFWIGPEVTAAYAVARTDEVHGAGVGVEIDGSLGYTFIIANHLSLSLGLGLGWRAVSGNATAKDGTHSGAFAQGLGGTGRLALGYAF